MFIGSGVCAIITWNGQERIKTSGASNQTEAEYSRSALQHDDNNQQYPTHFSRNLDAGLAMGAMCIILGLMYAVDFFVSFAQRKKILRNEKA